MGAPCVLLKHGSIGFNVNPNANKHKIIYMIHIHFDLNGKLVPRVYHWKTFSITRVYLTKSDVSAFTSAVVSDYKKLSAK